MFREVLIYLANPVFFTTFSLVIGAAYVFVWVTSLRDLVRSGDGLYNLGEESQNQRRRSRQPVLKYSGRRPSVRSKAVTEREDPKAHRVRITRAA